MLSSSQLRGSSNLEPRSKGSRLHCPHPFALSALPHSPPRPPPTPGTPRFLPALLGIPSSPRGPPVGSPQPAARSARSLRVAPEARPREAGVRESPSLRLRSRSARSSPGRRGSRRSATATAATLPPRVGRAVPRPWSPGGPLRSYRRSRGTVPGAEGAEVSGSGKGARRGCGGGVEGQDAGGAQRCMHPPWNPCPLRACARAGGVPLPWHLEVAKGKSGVGCLFHRFRPPTALSLPDLPNTPEFGPWREETRRESVPGRMCPSGNGYLSLPDSLPNHCQGWCSAFH